jgi:regulator of nucleoside diphosphate kinase
MLMTNDDLMISTADAETLALMFGDRRHGWGLSDDAQHLIEILQIADIVPERELPSDRVGIGSAVTYEEADGGAHTVALVFPNRAAPGEGRVSVLSPLGTALLGRSVGETVEIDLPNGRSRVVTIHAVNSLSRPEEPANADVSSDTSPE